MVYEMIICNQSLKDDLNNARLSVDDRMGKFLSTYIYLVTVNFYWVCCGFCGHVFLLHLQMLQE